MYIYVYICHILFINSDGSGYFNWLNNLAIMNTTAINMYVWTSLGYVGLEYFGSIHRSAIAVSYSNFIFKFGSPQYWLHRALSNLQERGLKC